MEVNIITDRGSSFVKAFAQYEPLYCFGHRINNILKIGFFQQQKKKKTQENQLRTTDIIGATMSISVTTDSMDQNETLSSSSESESSELEQEEEQQQKNESNEYSTLVIRKIKKSSSRKESAQKLLVDNIPSEAKQVLFILKQAKKLVNYVKLVSMQNIY